jgi:Phage integrase, N-terminal SAM-like domain
VLLRSSVATPPLAVVDPDKEQDAQTLHECPNKNSQSGSNPSMHPRVDWFRESRKEFWDLFSSLWPNYLDKEQVKPSTRASYHSAVDKWINPFFGRVLLEDIAFMVGDFMPKLGSARLSAKIPEEHLQPPEAAL